MFVQVRALFLLHVVVGSGMSLGQCARCAAPVRVGGRGRPQQYCSSRCRVAAYRARQLPALMLGMRWTRAVGKRPIMVTGAPASVTDPSTWSEFAEVKSGAGDGFGVMLGDGLGCWDLDNCLTGDRLAPWAAEVLTGCEPLLVERSVSGRGLHVFVAAGEAPGWRRGGIEFYSRARFIRVTLDRYRPA